MTPAPERRGERELAATPALERLLARLRGELSRLVVLHGLGSLIAALVLWLAFCFVADYFLHVPHGVRVFHLVVLLGLTGFVAWRELARPLARLPGRSGLAQLFERERKDLGELLVSAVDLQESPAPSGAPEQVREVLASAEARASGQSPVGVLDRRRPWLRFGAGVGCAAVAGIAALAAPQYASIFWNRLLGGSAAWPQRTQLALSIPVASERATIEEGPGEIRVRIARGSDLPVLVRATGAVPDEVLLHFGDGTEVALSGSGDGAFRTLLRSLQGDLTFYATGGDDQRGEPRVVLTVLEPPDVEALAVRIVPPAYTGSRERIERDRDVEVLAGSAVAVVILQRPRTARGVARILPDDRTLELAPAPFPVADAEQSLAPETGLGFELVAEKSLRFRFELEDDSGLKNPDPGLFSIEVIEDRAPEVEILSPARSEIETVRGGALRLVVRAEDDFGVQSIAWVARSASAPSQAPVARELEVHATPDAGSEAVALGERRKAALATERLELIDLVPTGVALAEGDQLALEIVARDSRPPVAGQENKGLGKATALRVRVVSEDEFLRRVQDRLSKLRVQTGELEELARAKTSRVRELITALESDAPGASSAEIAAVISGARRIQGDAEAISRELASIAEGVLYARLDDKAGALLETLDAGLAKKSTREFQVDTWREIAASHREGRAGAAPGLAGQLVSILDLAVRISHQDAVEATDALERAAQSLELEAVHAALSRGVEIQARTLTHIEELLARLAEWDNFQSILSLTRDILQRQKSLLDRTRSRAAPADEKRPEASDR